MTVPPRMAVFQHVSQSAIDLDGLFPCGTAVLEVKKLCDTPAPQVDLARYQGLIVLGGAMSLTEMDKHPFLGMELRLIECALRRALPVLGICLGAQLVSMALGGRVYRHSCKEIGWYKVEVTRAGRADPLFAHFSNIETVFQWHGDTFTMPPGATRLARSGSCENQAFRHGDAVYGVQFHPEMTEAAIGSWLGDDIGTAELAAAGLSLDADRIIAETRERIGSYRPLAREIFRKFAARCEDSGQRRIS